STGGNRLRRETETTLGAIRDAVHQPGRDRRNGPASNALPRFSLPVPTSCPAALDMIHVGPKTTTLVNRAWAENLRYLDKPHPSSGRQP
ncbi:hypothetical protein ACODYM_36455, partial [Burkholderia gladioli]|uniref:hypothetical protein n=1 Tax=Burkholderia gladioli TaxID=28095 RepID=UPI003B50AB77